MTAFSNVSRREPASASRAADSSAPRRNGASPAVVSVAAPARLHLGFLDPSGTLGRRFGSLGMMVDGMSTVLRMSAAPEDRAETAASARHERDRVRRLVSRMQSATGIQEPVEVQLRQALPPHVGLGSGTQFALAIGRAFSELHHLGLSTPEIARLLDRGGRSGIGIAGFDHGGVLVDGGPRAGSDAPPVLARFDFPSEWRVLLVQDPASSGLHGDSERAGIARLPPFAQAKAAYLCHLVLMQILPALAEADFAPFAAGLSELQAMVGSYFAPAQGGIYTSAAVGRLMRWIGEQHQAAIGQSSWGPTAFAIVPSESLAREVIASARAAAMDAGLVATIVAGRNRGAMIAREALPAWGAPFDVGD